MRKLLVIMFVSGATIVLSGAGMPFKCWKTYTPADEIVKNCGEHRRVYCCGAKRSQQLHPWLNKPGNTRRMD